MERSKPTKESQITYIKEIIAEFDIETQVNRMVAKCFDTLMRSNAQAFEVIAESEKKLVEFEARLSKSESFIEVIEENVNSKIKVTNSLNKRLEVFTNQFYACLKENESLVVTMRKDYDHLMANTQRNTYDLRALTVEVATLMAGQTQLGLRLDIEVRQLVQKANDQTVALNDELRTNRKQNYVMMGQLADSRAQFGSRAQIFQELSRDVSLYKYEKESIDNKLSDMRREVEMKLPRHEFHEMRLKFDSQLATEKERNERSFEAVRAGLSTQNVERKLEDGKLEEQIRKHHAEQSQTDNELSTQFDQIFKTALSTAQSTAQFTAQSTLQKIAELDHRNNQEHGELSALLQEYISLTKQQFAKNGLLLVESKQHIASVEQLLRSKIQQITETEAHVSSLSSHLNELIKHNSMKVDLGGDKETVKLSLPDVLLKENGLQHMMEEMTERFSKRIKQEHNDNQIKFTSINRAISQNSVEIMKNLQRSEKEAQDYTDQFQLQIQSKINQLNTVSDDMEVLRKANQHQMAETTALNKSMSEKMEKTTAILTKFRSDLSLRVDGMINEQQRRSLEFKESLRVIDELKKVMSNLTEALTIALAVILTREFNDQQNREPIKISSLLEGWVLELQGKNLKFRGDLLNKKRLVLMCLNFLVFQGDKIKGDLIENGKDVYMRMVAGSQQIFSARNKVPCKRTGSQLPKLHM